MKLRNKKKGTKAKTCERVNVTEGVIMTNVTNKNRGARNKKVILNQAKSVNY